jgi:hypothetical protein
MLKKERSGQENDESGQRIERQICTHNRNQTMNMIEKQPAKQRKLRVGASGYCFRWFWIPNYSAPWSPSPHCFRFRIFHSSPIKTKVSTSNPNLPAMSKVWSPSNTRIKTQIELLKFFNERKKNKCSACTLEIRLLLIRFFYTCTCRSIKIANFFQILLKIVKNGYTVIRFKFTFQKLTFDLSMSIFCQEQVCLLIVSHHNWHRLTFLAIPEWRNEIKQPCPLWIPSFKSQSVPSPSGIKCSKGNSLWQCSFSPGSPVSSHITLNPILLISLIMSQFKCYWHMLCHNILTVESCFLYIFCTILALCCLFLGKSQGTVFLHAHVKMCQVFLKNNQK